MFLKETKPLHDQEKYYIQICCTNREQQHSSFGLQVSRFHSTLHRCMFHWRLSKRLVVATVARHGVGNQIVQLVSK